MSVVLGVDPSLTTSGAALVRWDPAAVALRGSWQTWRGTTAKPELVTVASNRRRIRMMLGQILAPVPPVLTLSVVEGPAMGAKHTPLADERAGLRWMLIDQLLARGPVVLVTPSSRQALTGVGVIPRGTTSTVRKRMVTDAVRLMVPDATVADHNVADAVALAAAGAHRMGLSMPYAAKQISAHSNVEWPVGSGLGLAELGKKR